MPSILDRIRHWLRPDFGKRLGFIVVNCTKNTFIRRSLRKFQITNQPVRNTVRQIDESVAIVVPCYNHGQFLNATVASLSAQTYRPFEVIFVDDCSTDNSFEILSHLCAELPTDIYGQVLRTPVNSGQAAAINMGIRATRASVIMTLDADDYLMHDALSVGLALLDCHQNIYLLGAAHIPFSGDGPPPADAHLRISEICPDILSIPVTRYEPSTVLHVKDQNDINMTHSSMIFFRTAWEAVGGYCAKRLRRVVIFTDRDFQLRVGSIFPIGVSKMVPFVYYREDSSVQFDGSGDKAALWSLQSLLSERRDR